MGQVHNSIQESPESDKYVLLQHGTIHAGIIYKLKDKLCLLLHNITNSSLARGFQQAQECEKLNAPKPVLTSDKIEVQAGIHKSLGDS